MVKLPTYLSNTSVNNVGGGRSATAQDFGGDLGISGLVRGVASKADAMSQVSGVYQDISDRLQSYKNTIDQQEYSATMSAFELSTLERNKELSSQDYEPDVSLPATFSNDLMERAKALKIPNSMRAKFESDMQSLNYAVSQYGLEEQSRRTQLRVKNAYSTTLDSQLAIVGQYPDMRDSSLKRIEESIAALPGAEEYKLDLFSDSKSKIVRASADAMVTMSPREFLRQVEEKKWDDLQDQYAYVSKANRIILSQEEAVAARAQQESMAKPVEATLNDFNILDPTNNQHKKYVDAYWMSNQDSFQQLDPRQQIEATVGLVAKTGIYPSQVKSSLIAQIENGTPEMRIAAAEVIDKISQQKPGTIRQIDEQSRLLARQIVNNLNSGLDAETSVRYAEMNRARKDDEAYSLRMSRFKDERLKFDYGQFTESFRIDPSESNVPDAMIAEYNRLNERYFMDGNADARTASELATERVKVNWSITSVDGRNRWMKYAPDVLYDNGLGSDWMREQLVSDISSAGIITDDLDKMMDNIVLEVAPESIRLDNPYYGVFMRNDDGLLQPYMIEGGRQALFRPDFETSPALKRMLDEHNGDRAKAISAAKDARRRLELESKIISIKEGF